MHSELNSRQADALAPASPEAQLPGGEGLAAVVRLLPFLTSAGNWVTGYTSARAQGKGQFQQMTLCPAAL